MNKLIPNFYNSKAVRWHQKRRSSASILDGQYPLFDIGRTLTSHGPSLSRKTAVGRQSNLGLALHKPNIRNINVFSILKPFLYSLLKANYTT